MHLLPQRQRQFATPGVWLSGREALAPEQYPVHAAWHTLVHAVLAGLPLLLLSDANTLRGGVYEGAAGVEAVFSDVRLAATVPVHFSTRPMSAASGLPCKSSSTVTVPTVAAGVWPCSGVIPVKVRVACSARRAFTSSKDWWLRQSPPLPAWLEDAAPQHIQAARHVYLVLSTQKSAEDVGGWQHKHLLGLSAWQ